MVERLFLRHVVSFQRFPTLRGERDMVLDHVRWLARAGKVLAAVSLLPLSCPPCFSGTQAAGFAQTQGTLYTIQNGAQINATNVSFATQGTSRSTTIAVPPYSVQAISLK